MSDDEWVKTATVDDKVVAELLVMLKQVKQQPPPPPPPPQAKPELSLEWSVRQRRSKAVIGQQKKQAPSDSPTTPLSLSGATSLSFSDGGVGGYSVEEESSRPPPSFHPPKRSDISRSKVIGTCETTSNKRSRKKTSEELKEEENMLQKERKQLKRELANLRLNLEKERIRNENFKRIKLELQAVPAAENGWTMKSDFAPSDKLPREMACVDPTPAILSPIIASSGELLHSPPENACFEGNKECKVDKFMLPDLNIPFEENSSSDMLYGVS